MAAADPLQNSAVRYQFLVSGTYTVKKFGQEITTDLGFEYQSVSLYGLSADQPVIEIQEKDYSNRRKLYFDYRRDSRPNPFIPDRGSLTSVSVQICRRIPWRR